MGASEMTDGFGPLHFGSEHLGGGGGVHFGFEHPVGTEIGPVGGMYGIPPPMWP